jgi:hypothetical protein
MYLMGSGVSVAERVAPLKESRQAARKRAGRERWKLWRIGIPREPKVLFAYSVRQREKSTERRVVLRGVARKDNRPRFSATSLPGICGNNENPKNAPGLTG